MQPPYTFLFVLKIMVVLKIIYTVDHNIFAAQKFCESAPMYMFATQNFRECPSTSTKKKITITPGICRKKQPFIIIIMLSAIEALSLKPLGVSR